MPASLVGLDGNPWGQRDMDASGNSIFKTYHLLKFAAADVYAAGGIDITAALNTIKAQVPCGTDPTEIDMVGNGGYAASTISGIGGHYSYDPVSKKVSIWQANGTELGAGAVGAAVASDNIIAEISWRKLGGGPGA